MKEYTEKTSAVYVVTFFLLVFSGLVQPALAESVRAVPLTGTKWNLLELGGQSVPKDAWRPYFVLRANFRSESRSAGGMEDAQDECGNRLTGMFAANGDRLRIDVSTSTLVACGKRASELRMPGFRAAIRGESRFQLHGSNLDLLDDKGAVRARFVADDRN
jgi:heat shock protein HslJ